MGRPRGPKHLAQRKGKQDEQPASKKRRVTIAETSEAAIEVENPVIELDDAPRGGSTHSPRPRTPALPQPSSSAPDIPQTSPIRENIEVEFDQISEDAGVDPEVGPQPITTVPPETQSDDAPSSEEVQDIWDLPDYLNFPGLITKDKPEEFIGSLDGNARTQLKTQGALWALRLGSISLKYPGLIEEKKKLEKEVSRLVKKHKVSSSEYKRNMVELQGKCDSAELLASQHKKDAEAFEASRNQLLLDIEGFKEQIRASELRASESEVKVVDAEKRASEAEARAAEVEKKAAEAEEKLRSEILGLQTKVEGLSQELETVKNEIADITVETWGNCLEQIRHTHPGVSIDENLINPCHFVEDGMMKQYVGDEVVPVNSNPPDTPGFSGGDLFMDLGPMEDPPSFS